MLRWNASNARSTPRLIGKMCWNLFPKLTDCCPRFFFCFLSFLAYRPTRVISFHPRPKNRVSWARWRRAGPYLGGPKLWPKVLFVSSFIFTTSGLFAEVSICAVVRLLLPPPDALCWLLVLAGKWAAGPVRQPPEFSPPPCPFLFLACVFAFGPVVSKNYPNTNSVKGVSPPPPLLRIFLFCPKYWVNGVGGCRHTQTHTRVHKELKDVWMDWSPGNDIGA